MGNTVIMVINCFSKSLHLILVPSLPTAFETAELIFQLVFRYYCIPEDIVSDRATQYTSRVLSGFMEKLGVSISLTCGYHPQATGHITTNLTPF